MINTIWRRKENWVGSQIDDAFVMLNFEAGEYVSLNCTATDIWNALEEPCSEADIVAGLIARYAVSKEQCTASVRHLLEQLHAKGLIQPSS